MCEGTRYTKEKYEASMEIAKKKGMPILKHHLLPRTKGFTLLASQIRGKGISKEIKVLIFYFFNLTLLINQFI
jgi:hypothetical protein